MYFFVPPSGPIDALKLLCSVCWSTWVVFPLEARAKRKALKP